ncbi:MAG: hemerythrin domain-containing protein, partial [Dehalococcoidia bacterium]|nr:hemerythrin domain-containing protein [Dehalococcoidia bacterium]
KTQLAATIDVLWTNLKKHFTYEEQHLTASLGEILSRAIIIEHEEIGREIQRVRQIINETNFEGLTQADVLARKDSLQQAIGKISQMIEEHARDEEVLVKLVKKATKG